MTDTEFVYTTYIRSTPEKVWQALTTAEFQRQYWGLALISDWKKGSKWESDGGCNHVSGEVLENTPPKRLAYTWSNFDGEPGHSRVTFEIEPMGEVVRLSVVHDKLKAGSQTLTKISGGWPHVFASLKSLLETGKGFDIARNKESAAA
jgi:uncharacterized protein YndB with AHSA1/START domain